MRQAMTADDERDFETMAPGDEAPPGTEGTGEDICPECGGDGKAEGATCPECEGSGTVIKGVGGA
jgi:DnaJ-class molecular chaperone